MCQSLTLTLNRETTKQCEAGSPQVAKHAPVSSGAAVRKMMYIIRYDGVFVVFVFYYYCNITCVALLFFVCSFPNTNTTGGFKIIPYSTWSFKPLPLHICLTINDQIAKIELNY